MQKPGQVEVGVVFAAEVGGEPVRVDVELLVEPAEVRPVGPLELTREQLGLGLVVLRAWCEPSRRGSASRARQRV